MFSNVPGAEGRPTAQAPRLRSRRDVLERTGAEGRDRPFQRGPPLSRFRYVPQTVENAAERAVGGPGTSQKLFRRSAHRLPVRLGVHIEQVYHFALVKSTISFS